jgi:hypothetical protein
MYQHWTEAYASFTEPNERLFACYLPDGHEADSAVWMAYWRTQLAECVPGWAPAGEPELGRLVPIDSQQRSDESAAKYFVRGRISPMP